LRLKSITLKGFKSFPDRTRLDFGEGVSVVVGPNGSGKSNVTDAVLWAMGEQSPLAVRGQSMQDVIFGGGMGVQARSAAEVEIVLDNSDGAVDVPLSEISIVRRLSRSGEGEYRLNGARCRLTDVIDVLSPAGLGRATHSIVSQGQVEEIVTSRPRERRLLIEEAAGLGRHRKRRRRAQLKLERTQENLDRVLDVEREARTRLRPLKRQAEAAELHERLERQILEARWELGHDSLRSRRLELAGAERRVEHAREQRASLDARLRSVIERRTGAERALTERAERRDELASRLYAARSARERLELRSEQVASSRALVKRSSRRLEQELERLGEQSNGPRDFWEQAWEEVRRVLAEGTERVLAEGDARERSIAARAVAEDAERIARAAVERALREASLWGEASAGRGGPNWLSDERVQRSRRLEELRSLHAACTAAGSLSERLRASLAAAGEAVDSRVGEFEQALASDRGTGEELARELRACAGEEAEIQARLRAGGDLLTDAEVAAQRLRDQAGEVELELSRIAERLGPVPAPVSEGPRPEGSSPEDPPLSEDEVRALLSRVDRLTRRREQLGPVNPLAQEEYAEAVAHVGELESRRVDLETALRELRTLIRDTDREIERTFQDTFEGAARNFQELVSELFPGGSGRLRLVGAEPAPRAVLGGRPLQDGRENGGAEPETAVEAEAERAQVEGDELLAADEDEELLGVEIELTPAGKSTKRLSLLSGGEKSMTALAFVFAVFLARPSPFYILDEVEAALDDLNLDRFLALLRRYSDRAQFIVITHQMRTMEAADWLYGVSMAGDGVSKVISRRLPPVEVQAPAAVAEVA
jgi:chromosome segregation protein